MIRDAQIKKGTKDGLQQYFKDRHTEGHSDSTLRSAVQSEHHAVKSEAVFSLSDYIPIDIGLKNPTCLRMQDFRVCWFLHLESTNVLQAKIRIAGGE